MRPLRLPEPPLSRRSTAEPFEAGIYGLLKRIVMIGNGFSGAENQRIGLVRALDLLGHHTLYVALTLTTAAGAAAAAIVYLAHNGNQNTNWLAICQQFGDFCQKVSGAVVACFITVVVFVSLILVSGFALRRH